jgi:hypothetical protein
MGAIQTRRHCAPAAPQKVRDLFVREAFRIAQNHHDSLFLRQLSHYLLNTFLLLLTEQIMQGAFTGRPEAVERCIQPVLQ